MYTEYEKFLAEGRVSKKIPEDYDITKYKWVNGKLDCYQYTAMSDEKFVKFPFRFGNIFGNFSCSRNPNLKSLINGPEQVNGSFFVEETGITSLIGVPKIIDGSFQLMRDKNLKTIDHFPELITSSFWWDDDNWITKIEDYPLGIIEGPFIHYIKVNPPGIEELHNTIRANKERFVALLGNKEEFHRTAMRINPDLVKYYTEIERPSKRSII